MFLRIGIIPVSPDTRIPRMTLAFENVFVEHESPLFSWDDLECGKACRNITTKSQWDEIHKKAKIGMTKIFRLITGKNVELDDDVIASREWIYATIPSAYIKNLPKYFIEKLHFYREDLISNIDKIKYIVAVCLDSLSGWGQYDKECYTHITESFFSEEELKKMVFDLT